MSDRTYWHSLIKNLLRNDKVLKLWNLIMFSILSTIMFSIVNEIDFAHAGSTKSIDKTEKLFTIKPRDGEPKYKDAQVILIEFDYGYGKRSVTIPYSKLLFNLDLQLDSS